MEPTPVRNQRWWMSVTFASILLAGVNKIDGPDMMMKNLNITWEPHHQHGPCSVGRMAAEPTEAGHQEEAVGEETNKTTEEELHEEAVGTVAGTNSDDQFEESVGNGEGANMMAEE